MDTIVGYTYRGENYDEHTLRRILIAEGRLSPAADGIDTEEALDLMGFGVVNRQDERSFDSDHFPKVIFEHQLTCSDQNWSDLAPNHVIDAGDQGPEASECTECGDAVHFGHTSRLGGQWWCDTCNSPYCELA